MTRAAMRQRRHGNALGWGVEVVFDDVLAELVLEAREDQRLDRLCGVRTSSKTQDAQWMPVKAHQHPLFASRGCRNRRDRRLQVHGNDLHGPA
jgi:hypothetical protein